MSAEKLSKTVGERIKAADQDVVVWDNTLPGFGVRVKPSGVRSYIIQYRNRNTSASRRLTIGQHGPLLTFDQAKKQAHEPCSRMLCAARIRLKSARRRGGPPPLRISRPIIWKGTPFRR